MCVDVIEKCEVFTVLFVSERQCRCCVQVGLRPLETAALFYEPEHEGGGGRPRCEFTSQNALLSDVPPSKTYRHSRGMNGDECVTAATAAC